MSIHAVGSRVWVHHDAEGWVKAEVVKVAEEELVLKTELGEEQRRKPQDCPLQNPDDHRGVEVRWPPPAACCASDGLHNEICVGRD